MADSRKRITGAFLIGGALVAGSFFVSRDSSAEAQDGTLVVAPERTFISIKDSNNDGIPDWRESLQRTETIELSSTSATYTPPTTITGKFAVNFLEDLIRSKTYGQFGASPEELVEKATKSLIRSSTDVLFTEKDIRILESTDANLIRAYGNHIAAIALSQKTSRDNEAIILQDALRYNDKKRLDDLDPIAASYVMLMKQMLAVDVPSDYVKEHLDLLNAYSAIREDIRSMENVYDDPLYTFVRLKRYPDDVLGLYNALSNMFEQISAKHAITYQEGEPANTVVTMLKTI